MSLSEETKSRNNAKKPFCDLVSGNPFDYVEVALALEVLAYHNKNYLSGPMSDDCIRSEEMQLLLTEALKRAR